MKKEISPGVLRQATLDPFHAISAYPFEGRPTIVLLIVHGGRVLFVRGAKDLTWMLPQGGIQRSDRTLLVAALREGYEELGLLEQYTSCANRSVLGECLNPMAPERSLAYANKHLFFILIPVQTRYWVVLNHENIEYAWVSSYAEMLRLDGMEQKLKMVKFQATCEAIDAAAKKGLLPWSCNLQNECVA